MTENLEIAIGMLNLGAFAVVTILGITLTKKLYGGRFSSTLPYLIAGVFLIFLMVIFDIFIFFWIPPTTIEADTYLLKSSIKIFAIVAGILLLTACYKLYLIKYATAGFEVEENG